MASQSLYRKWRSQTFAGLIGQEPIVRTLKNALNEGKLAHAYLFAGPRGTGKTSTARLLAKTINCASPAGGEPCNTCQQCREITAGNSFNVIEIDAASNRGIDSIRDLREKVMMPPSTGKYKVYVLDEAHMLTTEAFNALLKTLEEPPEYAIFVMATTDVHKMLPTVLSRCQRFDFKRITTRQIVEHLIFVAEHEHIQIERPAAELIARAAAGGMRDALSLLDQAIAYSGNEISLTQVQAMLGIADPLAITKLVTKVAQLDSAGALHLLHELAENGADLARVNLQAGEYWRAVMAKAGADIAAILDYPEDETREISQMAPLFELEELTEFARVFAQNDLMQKNQATPQLALELACLQCIELHRRAGREARPSASSLQTRPAPLPAARPQSPYRPAPGRHPIVFGMVEPASGRSGNFGTSLSFAAEDVPEGGQVDETIAEGGQVDETIAVEARSAPTSLSAVAPRLTLQQVRDAWEKVKKRVKQKNQKTAAMLNRFAVVRVHATAEMAIVDIQAAYKIHHDFVKEGERSKDVDWALSMEFDLPCRVRLIAPGRQAPEAGSNAAPLASLPQGPQTPQQTASPVSREPRTAPVQGAAPEDASEPVVKNPALRENTTKEVPRRSPEAIRQKVDDDPVVQEVVRTFGAKIVDIRLK